jgi:hypothetical protein
MPDGAYQLPELAIEPILLDPSVDVGAIEDARLVVRLRQRVEKGRLSLERHQEHLQRLFTEIEQSNLEVDELRRLAEEALERERATTEQFDPGITSLKGKLARNERLRKPDARPYFEEAMRIADGWARAWHLLYERILECLETKQGDRVLLARPMTGEVDWTELSREHIARYPKIRARLAE